MGNGAWSGASYTARAASKRAAGHDTFHYTTNVLSSLPRSSWKPHETLEPKIVAGEKSPHAGQVMRECMISDEHPDPTPIAVFFDVTGSMGGIPRVLQANLGKLHGLLVRKGYATDPQIMFGAVGDAYCDTVPFQVGQFESDNRMDENLENLVLEGAGGGGNHESYDVALWFLANRTYMEPFEQFGKKGYAFIIGDERAYPVVKRGQVETLIGDTNLQGDIPIEDVIADVQEKYHLFYLYAKQGSYSSSAVLGDIDSKQSDGARLWRPMLGQHAIELAKAEAVCETIALSIGMVEGAVGLDDGLADIKDIGSSTAVVDAVGNALATLGDAGVVVKGGSAVAEASGELPGLDAA